MKQKGSSDVKGSLWNHLDKKVLLWHRDHLYFYYFYYYYIIIVVVVESISHMGLIMS